MLAGKKKQSAHTFLCAYVRVRQPVDACLRAQVPAYPYPHKATWPPLPLPQVDSTWVTNFSPLFKRNLARASSRLELPITASLVSSGTSLMVTCVATQGGSAHGNPSYNSSTYVTLKPRRPPSFWEGLFSSGGRFLSRRLWYQHCDVFLFFVFFW